VIEMSSVEVLETTFM